MRVAAWRRPLHQQKNHSQCLSLTLSLTRARPPSPSPHPDYGFAYSDDEVAEEDADIENAYYSAKGALEDGGGGPDAVRAALAGFQEVLAMEAGVRGDWGFKALKQVRWREREREREGASVGARLRKERA